MHEDPEILKALAAGRLGFRSTEPVRIPGRYPGLDWGNRMYYLDAMREHMSITVPEETARRLRSYASRERRPVSQVVEIAIETLLQQRMPESDKIVTTEGSFKGAFSREDTYEGR